MKKSFLFIFALLSSLSISAKDLNKDVIMVSYEQSWLDSEGTIALKNNTKEEIRNISFLITYLDMQGNELDYREFIRSISIAPGMTRKLDIPSYEHSRSYHYYKTKDEYGHPAFKIKYQLKDYNFETENIEDGERREALDIPNPYSEDNSSWVWSIVVALIVVLIIISITIGMYVLVAVMAKNRHRNIAIWILLSILATPLLMVIILLIIGEDESYELNENRRISDD